MATVADKTDDQEMMTLLKVPVPLYRRIMQQAEKDKRHYKPEILIGLEEWCDARERKQK